MSGKLVIFKSKRPFSAMAIDQVHGPANVVIKSHGEAICITGEASALWRWMVVGPEVRCLVTGWERKLHVTHSVDLYSGQILV